MQMLLSSEVDVNAVDHVSAPPQPHQTLLDPSCPPQTLLDPPASQLLLSSLQKGNTALHYVCERKSQRLVPLLLQKQADAHVQNAVRPLNTRCHEASDDSADPSSFFWSSAGRRDAVGHRHQIEVQQHR